jgi:hypothetical protein
MRPRRRWRHGVSFFLIFLEHFIFLMKRMVACDKGRFFSFSLQVSWAGMRTVVGPVGRKQKLGERSICLGQA